MAGVSVIKGQGVRLSSLIIVFANGFFISLWRGIDSAYRHRVKQAFFPVRL
jgi:hypothetical protein